MPSRISSRYVSTITHLHNAIHFDKSGQASFVTYVHLLEIYIGLACCSPYISDELELAVVKHRNLFLKKENDLSFHEWIPFWRNILVFGELDQVLENGPIFWRNGSVFGATDMFFLINELIFWSNVSVFGAN